MEYSEYQDKAAEYMRLAIPLMRKYGIAMTPANYAVWYEYVAGKNGALIDAVDQQLESEHQLSDSDSRKLYERFFDREKDQAALVEMRQDIRRILTEVLTFLASGAVASEKSNHRLQEVIAKFHPDMSRTEMHSIVDEVLSEAKLVASSSEILTERLSSVSSEMRELKKDLDEAKREAKTDTLTKLANRKAFDDMLLKLTRESDKSGVEVCLIFSDLDMFKTINDTHGHLVGDQVLKVVANTLKDAVKGRDLVARYGGEEFAIILLNTSLQNAKKLAENIRIDVASTRVQRKDTQQSLGKITLSLGVAHYFPSEGVESFLQRADRALYMSKRKGRNAVTEAQPPVI
ncbi:GGDEF domain-containing protein [Methylophaga sp. 42_25_T18]|nr:GGDEF domain-containing protein [Methylophaga sp. 42_25_T18]OUR86036.1 GGDEF domain-containing protein [Methylophaga sp. 42_8_T64]